RCPSGAARGRARRESDPTLGAPGRCNNMRGASLTIAAAIGVLGITGVASAHGGPSHRSTVYRATLAPTAAAGTASITGRAQLVDGKRTNKLSLHMRGLAPHATYLWHIHQGSCAATGAPLAGWDYRTHDSAGNGTLTSNRSGHANTKGRSA